MEVIQSLIDSRNYNELVNVCEQMELDAATGAVPLEMRDVYSLLLTSYLLINDLCSARFARKRILLTNQSTDEIEAVWRVCVALWEHRYDAFYAALNGRQWSPLLHRLMQDLRDAVRQRVLVRISDAYTEIHVQDAMTYFGLPEQELVQALTAGGWSFDASTKMLKPSKQQHYGRESDLSQLTRFADIVLLNCPASSL